jgi:type I restriction enzyme, S subunit
MSTTASKVEPEIAEISAGNEPPEGWTMTPLSDIVCKLVDGSHNPPPKQTEGHPMFSARNIGDGSLLLNEGYRLISGKDFKLEHARTQVAPGDVLLTIVGSIGRSLVVPDDIQAFALQRSVAVMRPLLVDPKFLAYNFRAPDSQTFFQENGAGTAQKGVYLRTLSSMPVPLAPLPEQLRIVAKIEELLAQVNIARARLAKVMQILKRFRQAILSAACSGRLTEDWREKKGCIDTASYLTACSRANRQPDGEESSTVSDAPELPPTWCLTGIDALLSTSRRGMKTGPFGSSLKKSEHQASGIPVLGIENIGEMKFVEGSKIHISKTKAKELAEFDALPGDILISRSGTVGEVCVVPHGLGEARISTNIMRVTLRESRLLPTYFCYLFNGSPFVLRQVSQLYGGSTRDFLNQTILRSILFPVPPIEEQQEIVRRVEALFKLAEVIEKRIGMATKRADKLSQAILAKAFRGELVPTEAELGRREGRDYEPASQLLARIKKKRGLSTPSTDGVQIRRRRSSIH